MRAVKWILVLATLCASVPACGGAQRGRVPADPQAVVLQGELGNRFVPSAEPAGVVARFRVTASGGAAIRRPPINLALVVDTSGSMAGEPIEHARQASLVLLESLAPGDRLAVVAFGSRTELVAPSTELARGDLATIRAAIGAMRAEGTTDLAGGLQLGLQQVLANVRPGGINRVVLLSDGVPNDGSSLEALAQAAGEREVSVIALGLGLEYDEILLGRIAQLSGGRFHYVESSERVAAVFRDEVLRLERVVARSAVLTLQPGPGVTVESVIGQQPAVSGTAVVLSVGDLVEGETREVFVRLGTRARRSGAAVELVDARLSFQDALVGAGPLERTLYLGAVSTESAEELRSGRNDEVEAAAESVQAAAVTVEAIGMARGGELERARTLLDDSIQRAASRAEETGDERLAARASGMRRLAEALPSITTDAAEPGAPAALAPEEGERRVRESHDEAMTVILGQ